MRHAIRLKRAEASTYSSRIWEHVNDYHTSVILNWYRFGMAYGHNCPQRFATYWYFTPLPCGPTARYYLHQRVDVSIGTPNRLSRFHNRTP